MPEKNDRIISVHEGEENPSEPILKLGKMMTDVIVHKLKGLKATDPEYWGLKEVLTDEMAEICLTFKLRVYYTFEEVLERNPKYADDPIKLKDLLWEMSKIGIIEYDYGDHYNDDGPIPGAPRERRYRVPFFVPGTAELMNSTEAQLEANPAVASMFERMTFIPLAGITELLPPGGDGVGMHVIPVEQAVGAQQETIKIEKISYWLKKYQGHISAGPCSCRLSRAVLGDGCADDPYDWCIQLGDMADYCVETGRSHFVTVEEALEICKNAEANGFVHQITNIDGETKIFDICNCNVEICNALRTALLFNTPYLSRSSFTAKVDPTKCVACGYCVEVCPAGAVKLGQKLCHADGTPFVYPKAPLPDNLKWGKYAWDENYRDTARRTNTYATGTSPCKAACPAHVPVQAYLKKAHEGDYLAALMLIKKENPFPAVCGRICNKRCELACTRGKIDAPVSIDAVKKFVAELELHSEHRYIPPKVVSSNRGEWKQKIAIIGAGPAGLSAAYYLAEMGYKPTVFEKNPLPGGMMTYGIPTYKLEKDVIAAEIEIIKALGAEIKCGVEVGKDITIEELKKQGYQAFYIAIGCQGGRRPGVAHDDAKGTFVAVEYLRHSFDNPDERFEEDVVVVGGGNVAIDCARNAKRLGAKSVTMVCLEGEGEMPASKEEIDEALDEGIIIKNGWGPKEVKVDAKGNVKAIVMKRCVAVMDEEGKFNPKYEEENVLELKGKRIIFAIGQAIEWGDLLKGTGVTFWHGNYPIADKLTYQTADPDIYVGGDVYTGPKFVIDAIAAGHAVAESLHRHVQPKAHPTIAFPHRHFVPLDKDDITLPGYDEAGRQEEGMNPEIDHRTSFRDAHLTLTEEQVHIETGRCLSCGASVVDPHKCIGCGLCTTRCNFDAIHLERDHPECSTMVVAEKKYGPLLKYALKRGIKILLHSGSKEAREMRAKRKAWKKKMKDSPLKDTGNAIE